MKKFVLKNRTLFLVVSFVLLTLFSSRTNKVYAQTVLDPAGIVGVIRDLFTGELQDRRQRLRDMVCEPTRVIYEDIMVDQPQSSILRTHYFLTAAGPLNLIYFFMGTSLDNIPRCMPYFGPSINATCESDNFFGWVGEFFMRTNMPENCGVFEYAIAAHTIEGEYDFNRLSKTNGGLMGLSYQIYDTNVNQAPPVSMALMWNDTVGDIPLIGKTLAADPQLNPFVDPFSEQILIAWKVMRNIAFGFLSIYMLYVGILIMTRKHVDQRTVVSIQYALPKLLLAIFLIVFSYAFGTAIAQASWFLSRHAHGLVKSAFQAADPGRGIADWMYDLSYFGPIAIIILLAIIVGALAPITLLVTIPVAVIIGIIMLVIEIKIFVIYLKMLATIITAPLEFLLYSVPGSERNVTDWFKKMAAYGLSMISMRAIYWVCVFIGTLIFAQAFDRHVQAGLLFSGIRLGPLESIRSQLSAFIAFPILIIFGLIQAFTVPKKVEALIMGTKRR